VAAAAQYEDERRPSVFSETMIPCSMSLEELSCSVGGNSAAVLPVSSLSSVDAPVVIKGLSSWHPSEGQPTPTPPSIVSSYLRGLPA